MEIQPSNTCEYADVSAILLWDFLKDYCEATWFDAPMNRFVFITNKQERIEVDKFELKQFINSMNISYWTIIRARLYSGEIHCWISEVLYPHADKKFSDFIFSKKAPHC